MKRVIFLMVYFSTYSFSATSFDLGIDYFKKKQFTRASIEFEKYIKANPLDSKVSKAKVYKASALRRSGSYKLSVDEYEKLLFSNEGSDKMKSNLLYGLSESHRGLGNLEKSERYLTQILVLYPDSQATMLIKKKYSNFYTKLQWNIKDFSKLDTLIMGMRTEQ